VGSSIPFLLGLAVTAGVLIPVLLRMRASAAEAVAEAEALRRQVASLRQGQAQLVEDQRFLTQFLKEYPRVARELYSGLTERQVPAVLLSILQKSLDPHQAAVLVKRSGDKAGASPSFVVAASYPEGASVRVGAEIPVDTGEIGFAAESQIVVTRQDLQSETTVTRIKPGPSLPGLAHPDIIAPLVFDQEILGMIAVARPRKSGDPKAALHLVAQTGAQVLHTAAQVSRMKITAEMDGLTRVFNKKHMEQTLGELVYRAACSAYDTRSGASGPTATLSLFLFDIDHFKNYNDQNGHLAGDKLLQELARVVEQHIRKDDVFGRFGGEEFLLVLPHASAAQGVAAAEKIRQVIENHNFPFADKQPLGRMSISGGVAEYPHDGLDAPSLLHAADAALYEAKRQGRNRVLRASGYGAAEPAEAARQAQRT
jgi:diguanylate cyclase (GGDEF)-like protein